MSEESQINDAPNLFNNDAILKGTSLSTQVDHTPSADTLYTHISQTLTALETVSIDGQSPEPIPTALLANSFKGLIPDTESSMKLSEALPMSDADIKFIQIKRDLENSLESVKAKLSATSKTLKDIAGSRIRVAYRLCRYMSHLLGYGKVGEPSIYTMAGASPEVNLYELPFPYDPMKGESRGMQGPRVLLRDIYESQYTYTYIIDGQLFSTKGMSVLPPPLHDGYYPDPVYEARKHAYTPVDYDPGKDVPLSYYLNIMEMLVRYLEIGSSEGGGAFTGIGEHVADKTPRTQNIDDRTATMALLNPVIARLAWPCRDDLETFEEYVMIPYVLDILIGKSPMQAEAALKEEMGLTHPEARDYIEVAKTYAREAHNFDPERERSVLIHKVFNLAARCGEASMVSTELKSYMSAAQILGLTKHVEDTNIDKREGLRSALEEKFNASKLLQAEEDDNEEDEL